jgi:mono/diheme cytochrome c family protein
MSKMFFSWNQRSVLLLVALVAGMSLGCSPPVVEFRPAAGHQLAREAELDAQLGAKQKENIATILDSLFGTPNEPHVPVVAEVDMGQLLNQTAIEMAAGAVSVDEDGRPHGLYRQHCAHCHGITGDGMGPTAEFLNPYPRDYRMGKFKFKSTTTNARPTEDDLQRLLKHGVPGTAMPSFRVLPQNQKDSLVQYVIYLSMRGELERLLIGELLGAGELGIEGPEEVLLTLSQKNSDEFRERSAWVQEKMTSIASSWLQARSEEVPPPPENWGSAESRQLGRDLFYGTRAGCVKCHGNMALGDGDNTFDLKTPLVDDWTKENWPKELDAAGRRERETVGILAERPLRPRNLRQGVYRGGRRPVDLYWRIRYGISGTPMPAAKELKSDEIWYLLDYVRSLPFESISQPHEQLRNLKRERL